MEKQEEQPDECNLSIKDFIKAFSKLVYITIYGFPTSKTPLPDVSSKKEGKDKIN